MWLLLACAPDIHPLYEAARAEALGVVADRPAEWSPDLSITVAAVDFERVLEAGLTSALRAELAGIGDDTLGLSVSPRIAVEEAKIRPVDDCAACLGFRMKATGSVQAKVLGLVQSLPMSLSLGGVLGVEVRDGRYVFVKPLRLNRVAVDVSGLTLLGASPSRLVQDALQAGLADQIPTIQVLALDTDTVPVRDLRLSTTEYGITIDALTNVAGALPIRAPMPPSAGLRVSLSETALTGLARRAAYQAGTFSYETAVDPVHLEVDGNSFSMDLRVWRLAGKGWWRDYRVNGSLLVKDGKIQLRPDAVEQVGQSPGAALVDPLAALFEGKILETVAEGIDRSLPGRHAQEVGKVRIKAAVTAVSGVDDALVVDALLQVEDSEAAQGTGTSR